jgi:hypothetical protein
MNTYNLQAKEVKAMNTYYVHGVDKLYRMFGGLSSELVAVKQGTAFLEVVLDDRWKKGCHETALQLVESRSAFNEKLAQIPEWDVKIYRRTDQDSLKLLAINGSKLKGAADSEQDAEHRGSTLVYHRRLKSPDGK